VNGPRVQLPVVVNGVPLTAELTPEAVAELRAALALGQERVESPFLTPDEAAELLRCGRRRIYDLVRDGRLRRCGEGRRLLVRREDVFQLAKGRDPRVTP
jgi:excisionase family DNA binding protein